MLEAEIEIIPGLPQVGIGGKDSTLRRALIRKFCDFPGGLAGGNICQVILAQGVLQKRVGNFSVPRKWDGIIRHNALCHGKIPGGVRHRDCFDGQVLGRCLAGLQVKAEPACGIIGGMTVHAIKITVAV